MSNFRKRLATIRSMVRMADTQETTLVDDGTGTETKKSDEELREEFIEACHSLGYYNVPEKLPNGKPIITPYVLMANNSAFINTVANAPDKQTAIDMVLNEVDRLNTTLGPYHQFFSRLSNDVIRLLKLRMEQANGSRRMGMNPQQQIAKLILDSNLRLEGNGVIYAAESDNVDDEVEKIVKELVGEFERRIRSLLTSVMKRKG